MRFFQKFLLWIYYIVQKIGLLENSLFKKLFWRTYFLYKRQYEDPFFGLTNRYPEFFREGNIIDVGANIGYTATVFARAITSDFQVYAFEPDPQNFDSLRQIVSLNKLQEKVVPVQAAVGETKGAIQLWHNKNHHADHRIATRKFQTEIDLEKVSTVDLWSIDSFVVSELKNADVKFIKIDVQGYEFAVCLGMEKTLTANPNAVVALEYMPESIEELGFEPEQILQFFQDKKYFSYIIEKKGNLKTAHHQLINKLVQQKGYIDLLFSREALC